MPKTLSSLAIEVDRTLGLNLSNFEFEILVSIILDSEDPEQTAINMMNCGFKATHYIIQISK